MKWDHLIARDLVGMEKMTAGELGERLAAHFAGLGGLAGETETAIARELVRRARRAENLEQREVERCERSR